MPSKPSARSALPNGEVIKRLRLAQKRSQKEFARLCGITERTLQRAEGGVAISSHFLGIIATGVNVPIEQILVKEKRAEGEQSIITLSPVKGRQLIGYLQFLHDSVTYDFRIDP